MLAHLEATIGIQRKNNSNIGTGTDPTAVELPMQQRRRQAVVCCDCTCHSTCSQATGSRACTCCKAGRKCTACLCWQQCQNRNCVEEDKSTKTGGLRTYFAQDINQGLDLTTPSLFTAGEESSRDAGEEGQQREEPRTRGQGETAGSPPVDAAAEQYPTQPAQQEAAGQAA
eukprot:10665095-Ditylum_brightwellii.AAC.1